MRKYASTVLLCALLICCLSVVNSSSTIYVSTVGNDSNTGSISQPVKTISAAIVKAVSGNKIIILPGVYSGNGNCGLDIPSKSLTISGNDDITQVVIDCQLQNRVFSFNQTLAAVSIEKMTIKNGRHATQGGGGIWIYKSNPIIQNVIIQGCQTSDGKGSAMLIELSTINLSGIQVQDNIAENGAVCFIKSTASVQNSQFKRNKGTIYGGGLYSYQSSLTITNTVFEENQATGSGGGISIFNTAIQITSCTFTNNIAGSNGGAVYSYDQAINPPIIKDSIFTSNKATSGSGGGLYLFAHDAKVQTTTFKNNQAGDSGGGLYIYAQSKNTPKVSQLTVINNKAGTGGGVFLTFSIPECFSGYITDSTFSSNQATGDGGGLYVSGASACESVMVLNSVFSQNTASGDGGGFNLFNIPADISGSITNSNNATNNGAGGFIRLEDATTYTVKVSNSEVTNNKAINGNAGGLYIKVTPATSQALLKNVSISNNNCQDLGGGVYFTGNSQISLDSSVLRSNKGSEGGGLYAITQSSVVFKDSILDSNKADKQLGNGGGAAVFTTSLQITNSSFTSNEVQGSGGGIALLVLQDSTASITAEIEGATFLSNKAVSGGGFLFAPRGPSQSSTVIIRKSYFNSNIISGNVEVSGAGAYLSSLSSVTISDSLFSENNANSANTIVSGAGLLLSNIQQASMTNTTWTLNTVKGNTFGRRGAAVDIQMVNNAKIIDCSFVENSVSAISTSTRGDSYGGAIHITGSTVIINKSSLNGNAAQSYQGGSSYGGALYITERSSVSITNSLLRQNTLHGATNMGGAIFSGTGSEIHVDTSKLSGNTGATNGGAYYLVDIETATIIGSEIIENIADGNGGACAVVSSQLAIVNSTISNNKAQSGGALHLTESSSISATLVTVTNNQATYAGGIHSLPPNTFETDDYSEVSSNYPEFLEPYTIKIKYFPSFEGAIVPSEIVTPPPVLLVQDYYGEAVENDENSIVSIKSEDFDLTISGAEVKANNGIIEFSNLVFLGKIGSNYTIIISSNIDNSEIHSVNVAIANCRDGSEKGKSSTTCSPCKDGMYSYGGDTCSICPKGTNCEGNGVLELQSDVWRPSNDSSSILSCFYGTCSDKDRCVHPHTGNLCDRCLEGYQKYHNRCVRCPGNHRFWIIIAIVAVVCILGIVVFSFKFFPTRHVFGVVTYGQILVILFSTKRHDLHLALAPFTLELGYCVTTNAFENIILINLIPIGILIVTSLCNIIYFISIKVAVRKTRSVTTTNLFKWLFMGLLNCLFYTYIPVTYANLKVR
jgi:predicted outer membrane repeat protein